jgi:ubiquinone/menaquinone biosynthesis C-methylase UbiE
VERAKSSGDDEVSVTVVDINPEMLRVGEQRAYKRFGRDAAAAMMSNRALTFLEGNAQSLPYFQENTFDIYTIAFGLRNVTDVDAAIHEAYRVLKPGGRYMCLEFSRVSNAALGALYDLYSFHAIPKVKSESQFNIYSAIQFIPFASVLINSFLTLNLCTLT